MVKHIVKWKPVRLTSVSGREYLDFDMPGILDMLSGGELLEQIRLMQKQKPISLEKAIDLAMDRHLDAVFHGKHGRHRYHSSWYYRNFVEFVSEAGYHIELTGDEFESPQFPTAV